MLMLCICVVIFFFCYQANGAAIDGNVPLFAERVTALVEKKCLQNVDQDQLDQVLHELDNLDRNCYSFVYPGHNYESSERFLKRCYGRTDQVIQCLNRFGEKLEQCLEADEKYLVQFLPEIYRHAANYHCQHINNVTATTPTSINCLRRLITNPKTNPEIVCLENSNILKDNTTIAIITKSDLCSFQSSVKSCYENMLSEHCPDATAVKHFSSNLFKAALKPCTDVMVEGTDDSAQ